MCIKILFKFYVGRNAVIPFHQQFFLLLFLGFSSLDAMMYKCQLFSDPKDKKVLLISLANKLKAGSGEEKELTGKILALIAKESSSKHVQATVTLGRSAKEIVNIREWKASGIAEFDIAKKILSEPSITSSEPSSSLIDFKLAGYPASVAIRTISDMLAQFDSKLHRPSTETQCCDECKAHPENFPRAR